jgi:UDP-N-acetylglucosamine acyltransferase
VHQHVRVGAHAMVGGMTPCTEDVVPFGMVVGNPAHLSGLNLVGLKRRGFDRASILTLRAVYRSLFEGPGTFSERLERTAATFATEPLARSVLDFVGASRVRSLCKPGRRHGRY